MFFAYKKNKVRFPPSHTIFINNVLYMRLYFVKTCNGWLIKRDKCASPSYIKSIIYFTQSNARYMDCIYKIYIGYCLYQALYELETNQILQLQSLFPILDTSTCTSMGTVSSADGLSELEEIKWTKFLFFSSVNLWSCL